MLHFPRWLVTIILALCAAGVVFTLPNLLPAAWLQALPSFLPKRQVSLGLDLKGGVHLVYEVEMGKLIADRLGGLVDELRPELAKADIGYTDLGASADSVHVQLKDGGRLEELRTIVTKLDKALDFKAGEGGVVTLAYPESALAARRDQILTQTIEIIRRRIDETGTREATIQREGEDRVLVQVPGVKDPEHLKLLIGKTAKMTFQMVDGEASAEEGKRGRLPAGDQLVSGPEGELVVKRRILVSGESLTDAEPGFDRNGQPAVDFRFDAAGARRFGDATEANVGKRFAIILDNKVISAPRIQEPIRGGSGQITGNFTVQSANDLSALLRAGALPAELTIVEERTVGPELGADSIHAGALASLVGVTLVVAFMVIFYGLFGVFANVALFFNLCLMMAALTLLGATLTLPGIAGIALTLGMAVDANVLIYERIREELRAGRSVISSLQAGFERAFGTILDSHVTTLVAGALMFFLGSGPVKGFAVTLSLGVVTSLFSAILVTRLEIVTWLRRTRPKTLPI